MMLSDFFAPIVCLMTLSHALVLAENTSHQSFWDMDPSAVRKLYNDKAFAIAAEKPEVHKVENVTIKNDHRTTDVRIYTPNEGQHLPVILLIHGGAWVGGNLETHDNMARYLCKEVQALVVSVGYLNSPEGKFPLPLEQCYDALLWTIQHASEYHADTTRLAVVGDSAGGNMAAALCLLARDRKAPKIDLQVLINPVIDLVPNGTMQRQGDEHDQERWYTTQYIQNPSDVENPYAAPIKAKDLTHLPPALVILGGKDGFRPAGQSYADRLTAAGIPTNVYIQWNVGHLAANGARASLIARESLDVVVAALRGAFVNASPKL